MHLSVRNACMLLLMAPAIAAALFSASGCAAPAQATRMPDVRFYKVGHRGTRGLMPENTIPSFEKAIAVGANTIEFDVHITRDSQVVIYHDDSFTPSYTTLPDGTDIPPLDRKRYTFYQMPYQQIRRFIIGEKAYPAFPLQQRIRTYAPLLAEMIDSVELYTRVHHYPPVIYLLEVKSSPATDGFAQPDPETFMRIMMGVLEPYLKGLRGRLIIQSFDMRPLQVIHRDYPQIPIGFLSGNHYASLEEPVKALGFVPDFYNPQFALVTPELVKACHDRRMKIVPWTVEDVKDMQRLKDIGVDGLITDYPDRLQGLR